MSPNNKVEHKLESKYLRYGFLLIPIILLNGCFAPQPLTHIPQDLQYVVPAGQKNSLATLVGSNEKSTPIDDFTVYILAVDGKRVISGRENWGTALPIQPGLRTITVAFMRNPLNAQADLQLQAIAGGKYQIQFSTDAYFFGADTYCDFWIIDIATQKPVTGIMRGTITNSIRYIPPID